MSTDATLQVRMDGELKAQVEINARLSRSEEDIASGRVYSQEELDSRMRERFACGRRTAI